MAEWMIDLTSFIVEADTEAEATKIAKDMIDDEQFEIEIVNIERWDT